MDHSLISLVFISYTVLVANAKITLKVSNDITVKPTPDPLTDVSDVVNVTLRCEGSSQDLGDYIRNLVTWTFISATGKQLSLSYGFYPTKDAEHLFSGTDKRFMYTYKNTETGYAFDIHITKVVRSDEGIYRCSLESNTEDIIDSKDVKLKVVNPVQTLTVELYDAQCDLIAKSSSPVIQTTPPVNITPGQYLVKCVASGSNPEPVMNLYLNELKPYVDNKISEDNSTNLRSYTGVFARNVTIPNNNDRQELVCKANIPGEFYATSEAGFVLMTHSGELNIVCENTKAAFGDRYCLIKCKIIKGSHKGAPRCDLISWSFGTTGRGIGNWQIWKDQNNVYGDIESTCVEIRDGLIVTLNMFTVTSKLFEGSPSLVYENGAQNVSYSVEVCATAAVHTTIYDSPVIHSVTYRAPVSKAAVFTQWPFLTYLVVVVIASYTLKPFIKSV